MGNFWGTLVDKPSPRTTKPSTLGTVKNNSNDDELSDNNISTNRFSAIGNLDGMILPTPNFRIFCFSELKTATRNFSPDSVLGEDGFGTVFKGWLDEKTYSPSKVGNGMEMTIKRKSPESWQGSQEWLLEVDILGRLSHPNLIKLLGCCREDEEVLIVYEFMQQGSLASHLFQRVRLRTSDPPQIPLWREPRALGLSFLYLLHGPCSARSAVEPLSWSICLKIAIGAAQGLAFLHTLEKKVIHRDIKASSILLDGNYNAKISSFGLAAYMPSDFDTHLPMPVVGTYGYAAPEYIATGDLNVKSDVYGFGVVLLEMLTGLRTQDRNRPSGQQNLVDWVKPSLSNPRKLQKIMDARLEDQYVTRQVWEAANLTLNCLAPNPKCRPSTKEVVETLQRLEAEGVQNHHPKHDTHRHKHLQAVGV